MMKLKKIHVILLAVSLSLGVLTMPTDAVAEMLVDENTVVEVDPESVSGMKTWEVDGVSHLFQQWFWYRVGPTDAEKPLNTLVLDLRGTTDTDFDSDPDTLFLRYLDPQRRFSIELKYTLTGGQAGSGTSDLAEVVKIDNTGDDPLEFHFFQYSNFDLGSNSGDDTVWFDIGGYRVLQTSPDAIVSETVVTSSPQRHEAGLLGLSPTTLDKLEDAVPSILNNESGPLTGDATWAFQWDFTLNKGGTFLISKDKLIVPEPSTLVLAALGMLGLLLYGWRRRRS